MEELKIPCKIKVQSGSINGEPTFIWIDAYVTRKNGLDRYVVREENGDGLYYVTSREIWLNWETVKTTFNKLF